MSAAGVDGQAQDDRVGRSSRSRRSVRASPSHRLLIRPSACRPGQLADRPPGPATTIASSCPPSRTFVRITGASPVLAGCRCVLRRRWRADRRGPSRTRGGFRSAAGKRRARVATRLCRSSRRTRSTVVISRSAAVKRPSTRCSRSPRKAARLSSRVSIRAETASRSALRASAPPPGCMSSTLSVGIGGSTVLSAANIQVRARARAAASVGMQRRRPFGEVQDDRARLEQRQPVVLERRHLAERLQGAIGRALLVLGADQPHLVGDPASSSAQRTRRSRTRPCANGGTQRKALRVSVVMTTFLCLTTNDSKESSTWPQPPPWLCARLARSERLLAKGEQGALVRAASKSSVMSVSASCAASPLCHWKVKTMRAAARSRDRCHAPSRRGPAMRMQ